jgi:hypothetical protein
MPNPPLLLCDADAIFQICITGTFTLLNSLRHRYSIQSAIVPEVEVELFSNRRHGRKLGPQVKKAIGRGTLRVLDQTLIQNMIVGVNTTAATARAVLASIQYVGSQNHRHCGRGEAYTHAAAHFLAVPALSNDMEAIKSLTEAGFSLPSPVLRAFDLLVFGFQIGELTEADCDAARQTLLASGEGIPQAFEHSSFKDGLVDFDTRLVDGSEPRIAPGGSANPGYASELIIFATKPRVT